MTILEALKKIKHLDRKVEKNRKRIARWCSYTDDEVPMYDALGIKQLLQSTEDLVRERNSLRHRIHQTNILTKVNWQHAKMTIDELLILRTLTLPALLQTATLLRRKEKNYHHEKDVKVVLQYDRMERDKHIDSIENTVDALDAFLDSVNITTELVG